MCAPYFNLLKSNLLMLRIFSFILLFFNLYALRSQDLVLGDYVPGNGLVFASSDDNYKTVLRGYTQSLFESKSMLFDSVDVLDNNRYNRFRARRVRLRLSGNQFSPGFSYRFQVDLAQSDAGDGELSGALLDAWIGYNFNKKVKIIIGQKATPTDNIELQMASNSLQLPERSRLTSAFSSIREVGIFLDGKFKIGNKAVIKPMLNITNGDGSNTISNDFGGFKYGARLNILPLGTFRNFGQFRQVDMVRELTPKFMIGLNGSYNVGISSRRGRGNGDILYKNDLGEYSLPNYLKFGSDFLFKFRGFSLIAEFVKTKVYIPNDITQRVRNNGTISTSFNGGVDNYIKGRMMLGSGLNIQAGYLLKSLYSVDARFTNLRPDEYSFMNNSAFYNRNKYYTLGLSKYFFKNYTYKVQASYTYVDDAVIRNQTGDEFQGNENILRLMVQIAF